MNRHLLVALATSAVALALPAIAAAKNAPSPYYVRATLAERYFATQADGSSWESQAAIDVEYRSTYEHVLIRGATSLDPKKVLLDRFNAELSGRGQGGSVNCKWRGATGAGQAPFTLTARNSTFLEVPWPGFPAHWRQTRTEGTSPDCADRFELNPLQGPPPDGETIWRPVFSSDLSSIEHFDNAVGGFDIIGSKAVPAAFLGGVKMLSRTTYKNGEFYTVDAWGTIVQSRLPITGPPQNYLSLVPDQPDASVPGLNALKRAGRKEIRLPKGCVRGEKRRKRLRCR